MSNPTALNAFLRASRSLSETPVNLRNDPIEQVSLLLSNGFQVLKFIALIFHALVNEKRLRQDCEFEAGQTKFKALNHFILSAFPRQQLVVSRSFRVANEDGLPKFGQVRLSDDGVNAFSGILIRRPEVKSWEELTFGASSVMENSGLTPSNILSQLSL